MQALLELLPEQERQKCARAGVIFAHRGSNVGSGLGSITYNAALSGAACAIQALQLRMNTPMLSLRMCVHLNRHADVLHPERHRTKEPASGPKSFSYIWSRLVILDFQV